MKLSQKLLLLSTLLLALVFTACKGKKDDPAPSGHKVKFKAIATAGSKITNTQFGASGGEVTSASNLNVTTWESPEVTYPGNVVSVYMGVGGDGKDANAVLKAQIYVDGVLKKESITTGTVFIANVIYTF